MASLEEKLLEELRPQVENLGKARNREIARGVGSTVPAVAASRRGGPTAALRIAQELQRVPGRPEGPSQMDVVNAKQSLLRDMGKYLEAKDDAAISMVDKLGAMKKANDQMLDIFEQYVSGNQSASAAVAKAKIALTGDMAKEYNKAALARMDGQMTGGSGRSRAAYTAAREVLLGGADPSGAIFSPESVATAAQAILFDQGMGAGDKAEAWAALDSEAIARGKDLRTLLAEAAPNDENASLLLNEFTKIERQVADIQQDTLHKVSQSGAAAAKSAMAQGAGMSMTTLVNAWDQFQQIYDPDSAAGNMEGVLDTVFEEMRPPEGEADLMGNYEKLLDSLDVPDETLSPHRAEAKRRLFADPKFRAMMAEKGLQTPQAALKWMRRSIRDQNRERRMADAKLMRDEYAGIERSTDSADIAIGEAGDEGESGTATAPGRDGGAAGETRRDEAFGDITGEDLSSERVAYDRETDELMLWDPVGFRWHKDHPKLDAIVAGLEGLTDEQFASEMDQLDGAFEPISSEAQRLGASRRQPRPADVPSLQEPKATPEAEEAAAPEPDKKPFLLPSMDMARAGVGDLLFGGGERRRKATGGINRALLKAQEKRKKKKAEEDLGTQ